MFDDLKKIKQTLETEDLGILSIGKVFPLFLSLLFSGVGLLSASNLAFIRSKIGSSELDRRLYGNPDAPWMKDKKNEPSSAKGGSVNSPAAQSSLRQTAMGNTPAGHLPRARKPPIALPERRGSNHLNDHGRKINPVGFELAEWTQWGPCNTTCGVGSQARTRNNLPGSAEFRECVEMDCGEDDDDDYKRYAGGLQLGHEVEGVYYLKLRKVRNKQTK